MKYINTATLSFSVAFIVAFTVTACILAVSFCKSEEIPLDLQIYQVVCIEEDGSDQIYEYVAETQQSYEYEKDFCQHVTSIR